MSIDRNPQVKKIDACGKLYLKYKGEQHELIEQEMRELGYHDFHRRILYTRFERGRCIPGWIERYGWQRTMRRIEADEPVPDAPRGRRRPRRQRTVSEPPPPGLELTTEAGGSANDFDEFQEWLKQVSPSMTWDWKHQVHIYKRLRRVTDGECKRMMIFLPPRHGKSELVTVRYTAWRLKRDPKLNVILGSYNQRLANRFSRKIRGVLADDAYCGPGNAKEDLSQTDAENADKPDRSENRPRSSAARSPEHISVPAAAAPALCPFTYRRASSEAEWETPEGGGVRAVGTGAGVTGFGAGLIIIDDPVKSRAEAESETYRDKIWHWFNDDLYTRLEPDGAIILIQTRWHEDDLAGRLLRDMREEGGEQWDVINLPALAEGKQMMNSEFRMMNEESDSAIRHSSIDIHHSATDPLNRRPGQALCPERYDETALLRLRRRLGSYSFSSLYQQQPVPAEGGLFKRKWFGRIIPHLPPDVKKKRGFDLGISAGAAADYTASAGVAYDAAGNMYIYDVFRRRIEYPEQRRHVLERIRDERDTEHGIELSANGNAVVQDLRREARVRGRALRGIRVKGDKVTRTLPWIALAEEGRVSLVRGPWIDDFLDEVCSFPSGTHDDQIDAVSLAVQMHKERSSRLYTF